MKLSLTPPPRGIRVVDEDGKLHLELQQLLEALVLKVKRLGGLVGQPVIIADGVQPGVTTPVLVYTDNGGTGSSGTLITAVTITNTSGSSRTAEAWIVPNGGSVSDATQVLDTETINANSSVKVSAIENQLIPPRGYLYVSSSAATTLTFRISGEQL